MELMHEILGDTTHTMETISQNLEDIANNPECNNQNTVGTGHYMEGTGTMRAQVTTQGVQFAARKVEVYIMEGNDHDMEGKIIIQAKVHNI
jgi:hypothetical protein